MACRAAVQLELAPGTTASTFGGHLPAGSGFTFVDRGPHRFEALGQEWPLFTLE